MRDDEKRKLHENIKQEMRSLLISSPKTKYGGLSGSLLYSDYKQLNSGKEVPYAELGFHSFLALLRSMPDVVRIEYKENSPSYRVHPVYDETTAHIQKMVFEQRDPYEYQNRLYSQNWYANNIQPSTRALFNFNNNGQLPISTKLFPYRTIKNMETNSSIRFHHNTNNFLPRPFPQEMFTSNERRVECAFRPYLLLTPPTPIDHRKQNGKINIQSIDLLPRVPSISVGDHEIYSTPNTFVETPPNFDFDDYRLHESIKTSEKDTHEDNNSTSCINSQINTHDDPLLTTSVSIIPDNPPNSAREDASSSSILSTSNKSILPPTNDDVSEHPSNGSECTVNSSDSIVEEDKSSSSSDDKIHLEVSNRDEQKPSKIDENEKLIKRIHGAIRQCIHFRYIHRLCALKFEYRHYPSSIETSLIKHKLEQAALNDYQQELEEFERISQFNFSIDDEKCRTMFDEHVYLQRNYYYMIKLMKKKR